MSISKSLVIRNNKRIVLEDAGQMFASTHLDMPSTLFYFLHVPSLAILEKRCLG
jgi:hypothetical protein